MLDPAASLEPGYEPARTLLQNLCGALEREGAFCGFESIKNPCCESQIIDLFLEGNAPLLCVDSKLKKVFFLLFKNLWKILSNG